MIPIVVTDKNAEDRRKGKKHTRKEARLCSAHVPGDTTLKFGVEFQENVDEAGKILFDCACRSGFGRGTYLHSVGDGASWIFGQAGKRFGPQGRYLVDFCRLCRYIIQERLKIAGAWWTPENARIMLSLRVDRADGYRERHRDNMSRAA